MIADDIWNQALQSVEKIYGQSSSLIYLKTCTTQFERINRSRYINDLKEFIFESSVEDFCDTSGNDIVVSTIHKAKGKEFDDVYMLLNDRFSSNDDLLRRLYVGITRAKKRLFIHTDSSIFNHFTTPTHLRDCNEYELPGEIALQLTHRDVYLNFFKERKKEILRLRGGDSLHYRENTLYNPVTGNPVAKLSSKMTETLSDWQRKGYTVTSATVRFIVAWRPKDAPKTESETAVTLIDLTLTKA